MNIFDMQDKKENGIIKDSCIKVKKSSSKDLQIQLDTK